MTFKQEGKCRKLRSEEPFIIDTDARSRYTVGDGLDWGWAAGVLAPGRGFGLSPVSGPTQPA